MAAPKVIDVEVVKDAPRAEAPSGRGLGVSPVHPLAAVLLLAVDNLWMLADWNAVTWIVTIPLSFLTVAAPTFLIQMLLNKDGFFRAAGLAFVLGTLAAIPTSLFGTPTGLALLAWSGLGRWFGRQGAGPSQ